MCFLFKNWTNVISCYISSTFGSSFSSCVLILQHLKLLNKIKEFSVLKYLRSSAIQWQLELLYRGLLLTEKSVVKQESFNFNILHAWSIYEIWWRSRCDITLGDINLVKALDFHKVFQRFMSFVANLTWKWAREIILCKKTSQHLILQARNKVINVTCLDIYLTMEKEGW